MQKVIRPIGSPRISPTTWTHFGTGKTWSEHYRMATWLRTSRMPVKRSRSTAS